MQIVVFTWHEVTLLRRADHMHSFGTRSVQAYTDVMLEVLSNHDSLRRIKRMLLEHSNFWLHIAVLRIR